MSKKYDYLVVGAGLYGAVFAHEAKEAGKSVLVIDKRPNIAGNVFTEDVEGIHVHKYGAHIFHTNNKKVWNYITRFAEFNRFTNSPVANYHGELYSLPFNMYTFNKMWGVVTPEEAAAKIEEQKKEAGITETPKTYDEFLEDIKKCTMDTNGDGKTDVYGFGMRGASGGQEPWGSFIYGEGGSFDDLTSDASVQGMQDFIDLYKNGYVPESATNDGFNETVANFKSGKTAMFIHHIGSSKGMVEELGDDVDAFIIPKGKGQWTSMGDTETVMFDSCENKAAAFEWMKYLATEEGQEMWCEGTGQVPVSQTVQQEDYFQNDKFMKVSMEGVDIAGTVPVKDTTTEWITNWPATISQALTGEITAKECMDKLDKALNE